MILRLTTTDENDPSYDEFLIDFDRMFWARRGLAPSAYFQGSRDRQGAVFATSLTVH